MIFSKCDDWKNLNITKTKFSKYSGNFKKLVDYNFTWQQNNYFNKTKFYTSTSILELQFDFGVLERLLTCP